MLRSLSVVAPLLLAVSVACAGPASSDPNVFGAAPSLDGAVTVETLLADPAAHQDGHYVVTGTVAEVCPKKGCWMTFGAGDESMRVTFLDYGFFVPMDIAGRTVTFEGTFAVEEVSQADARHYLEDAGRHEEAAALVGPQRSYTFVATGVRLAD